MGMSSGRYGGAILVRRGERHRAGVGNFDCLPKTPSASSLRFPGATACTLGLDVCYVYVEETLVLWNVDDDV